MRAHSRGAVGVLAAAALASTACLHLMPPAEPLPLDYVEEGHASYHGGTGAEMGSSKLGASREWDPGLISGAHRSLPLGSCVLVTNLENGFDARVHVTDHGAYTPGVVIDLSFAAARKLGMLDARNGLARVRLTPCD